MVITLAQARTFRGWRLTGEHVHKQAFVSVTLRNVQTSASGTFTWFFHSAKLHTQLQYTYINYSASFCYTQKTITNRQMLMSAIRRPDTSTQDLMWGQKCGWNAYRFLLAWISQQQPVVDASSLLQPGQRCITDTDCVRYTLTTRIAWAHIRRYVLAHVMSFWSRTVGLIIYDRMYACAVNHYMYCFIYFLVKLAAFKGLWQGCFYPV